MKLRPLFFHCKSGNWQQFHQRTLSKNYPKIKKIIADRDQNVCTYCGYPSAFNELINIDHNYNNNTQSNIAMACSLCQQVVLFDGHGLADNFGGKIIYMPEFRQLDLNHFMRSLYATMEKQPSFKSRLSDILITIEERKDEIEKIFGKTSSDARHFSQGLMDTFIDDKKIRHELMKKVKFIPDKTILEGEISEYITYYFD